MGTRRHFLTRGALAVNGIVLTGCGVLDAARVSPPSPGLERCSEPLIGDVPVRTIDMHAHCVIPEALALMNMNVFALYPKTMKGGQENMIVIVNRVAAMDA